MNQPAIIRCALDPEAGVWFVKDTDIPGLVTEAQTWDALRAKLPGMVRDLMDADIAFVVEQAGLAKAF